MSETAIAPAASAPTSKKLSKSKTGGAKKVRAKPSHPKTADMVKSAIKNMKERGGSSLQAIKKYISTTYKVDAEKMAPFIRKYLKSAVTSGSLVQTKGKGASGSFKLSASKEKAAPKKKTTKPTSSAKSAELKMKKAKITAAKAAKKVVSGESKKVSAKPKKIKKSSPSKAKKEKKVPTKKPRAPKPKKTSGPIKAKAPKKVAPKKK